MRTLARPLFALALLTLASGCIVVPGRSYYRPAPVRGPVVVCAPSQYWDGYVCRHRGNGAGARKHDRNVHGAVPVR